jgi:hypothetical protein
MIEIQGTLYRKPRPVHHMRINHRCRDIGMTEKFLHSSDIVSVFKKVRGKGMPEDMAAYGFGQSCLYGGFLHRLLQYAFVKMMSSHYFAARIIGDSLRWKDVLPAPFFCGIGVFSFKGRPEIGSSESIFQVPFMLKLYTRQIFLQALFTLPRKNRHAVFLPFTVPNHDLPERKIYVLHPKPKTLHQSKPAAIEKPGHKRLDPDQFIQ